VHLDTAPKSSADFVNWFTCSYGDLKHRPISSQTRGLRSGEAWQPANHCAGAQEAKRILDTVDTSSPLGQRDRAILEVFYATGIRKEELRSLTVTDLNLDEGLLRITLGKGACDRMVPLGNLAIAALRSYLHQARPQLLGTHCTDRLFISYRGKPMDPHTLGSLVKKHAQAAQIKKLVTPHVWRHTCATHLVQNRASLRHVQDLLGHKSLATTERYLRLTITDLKEAHVKFHPREQQIEL
jgi:integrase/recombinase XerD